MALQENLVLGRKLPFDSDYAEDMDTIHFLRLSYESKGIDYTLGEAPDGHIIHKNECEKNASYKERCKRTPTRSYVSSILNKYNSSIFRNEPSRQIDSETYQMLYDDVDGYGTTLNNLMKNALLDAQIDGKCFLLADSTANDTEILTIAQKNASGARPYIRKLRRNEVVSYTEIEDNLIEAIILLMDENGKTFARYMNDEVFIDIQLTDKFVIEDIGEAYNHGYNQIPLVEIEPFDSPQAESISYSQRTIVNILSQLSQERVKSVWTKHILSGVRLPQDGEQNTKPVISWSESEMVVLEDSTAKLDTLGADIGCSDSLRKDIEQEEQQLYYAAGFGKGNVEPTNMSGFALSILREDFFLTADALKSAIEEAENAIMAIIAAKESFDYTEAVYSNRYVADDNNSHLSALRDLLSLELPPQMKKLAVKNYIETFYNVSKEDMQIMENELKNMFITGNM